MKTKGIRIRDKQHGIVSVEIYDIIKEVQNGNELQWSILFLYATGNLGEKKPIPIFEKQINESEKGLFITWDELNSLAHKFFNIMDITLIGCKNKNFLHRYQNDQEMYETCDIVIEMIDSSYWEVFSKDEKLINSLAIKFTAVEFLKPDFKK